jgi:hypothetical protein
MKAVTPFEILDQWTNIVRPSLLPDWLIEIIRPEKIISRWAGELPHHRERLRPAADDLAIRILNSRSDQDTGKILLATPLELVAIYSERVTRAGERLGELVHLEPEHMRSRYLTWKDLAKDLLLEKPVISGFLCRFDFSSLHEK